MKLPPRIHQIVQALYDRYPAPRDNDEQRRALAMKIAQQVRFEFGPSWGTKRADPGRPLSKDAIAQRQSDGKLFAWDLFSGATGKPHGDPGSIDISRQVFVDVSPGFDYLNEPPTPPQPPVGSVPLWNEAQAVAFGQEVNKVYAETKRYPDAGMIAVHSGRVQYSHYVSNMPWAQAFAKHVAEFRAANGLR